MSFNVRIRLTQAERVQWDADMDRIRDELGHLLYKHIILMAVHLFAGAVGQLDLDTLISRIEAE